MANPVKGEVELSLKDGRRFTLVMDFEALVLAEGAYAKPMAEMLVDAKLGFMGATRAMLWGALRSRHPEVDLRDASEMLSSDGVAVEKAMTAATILAYPKAAEGGDKPRPPAKPRAGKSSGRSGAKPASSPRRSGGKPRAASA